MRTVGVSSGGVSGNTLVEAGDSASVDAFGRWRVSDPVTLFDSKLVYDLHDTWWETHSIAGGGAATRVANQSAVRMTTGDGANASKVYRQTRRYFQYQPGKSQEVIITGIIGAAVADVRKRWGYFDASNGLFWEQSGGVLKVVRRTFAGGSASDNAVAQSSWNIDKMDGTGPSGKTLDITMAQIFVIDFQWLGVGRVRFGLDIDGVFYPVHQLLNANSTLSTVYMTTPDLPVRYEIENTAAVAGATTMDMVCVAVISEGGVEDVSGYNFSVGNQTLITITTRRAVISIRHALTYNSLVNRTHVALDHVELWNDGGLVYWELVYNPTYTTAGGAMTWTAMGGVSGVEYSVHGDANAGAFTAGQVVNTGFVGGGVNTKASLTQAITMQQPLGLDASGANPRALALVCTQISGVTGTPKVVGSLAWHEDR